jgi:hypothetical protein
MLKYRALFLSIAAYCFLHLLHNLLTCTTRSHAVLPIRENPYCFGMKCLQCIGMLGIVARFTASNDIVQRIVSAGVNAVNPHPTQ